MMMKRPIGAEKIDLARILSSIKPIGATAPLAVCYYRVSTEKQAEKGNSLPEQREQCLWIVQEISRHIGQPLEAVEFEDHISGDFLDRPAVEDFRAFIAQHKPAFFICFDPDRFSRKLKFQLVIADEIERTSQLVFLMHDKQDNPEGQLFFTMRGAIAEFEKAKILERTRRGVIGKLKTGRLPYQHVAYGYQFNKETDLPEVLEDEARVVEQIFRWWVHDDWDKARIARKLNEMGVPTKKGGARWYRSNIESILHNEAYKGSLVCRRYDWTGAAALLQLPKNKRPRPITAKERPEEEWIRVPIPRIISDELWDAAQRKGKAKRGHNQGKFMLSGLVYCGLCGAPVHYIGGQNGCYNLRCGMRYPKYENTARALPSPCTAGYTRQTIAEKAVLSTLADWLTNPDHVRRYLQEPTPQVEQMKDKLEGELRLVREQITLKRREQAEIVGLMTRRLLDRVVAEEQLANSTAVLEELTTSEASLASRLSRLSADQDTSHIQDRIAKAAEALGRESGRVRANISRLNQEQARAIITLLVGKVLVYPKGYAQRVEVLPNADPVPR